MVDFFVLLGLMSVIVWLGFMVKDRLWRIGLFVM